jgi:AcrR family transcriptional regulator
MAQGPRQARRARRIADPAGRGAAARARRDKPRTQPQSGNKAGGRKRQTGARRQAILEAALSIFAARGYAAARLDDVAAQAGVAKGTLYLYFRDKQALFEELVRGAVTPIMDQVRAAALTSDIEPIHIVEMFFGLFQREVLGSDRKLLLRLMIAEGPRFPAITAFYHREVVSRGMALMRTVAQRAVARGEFSTEAAARFPQLIVAPLLLAVIWDGLFSKIEPLDVGGLLRAHCDLLTAGAKKSTA